MPKHHMEMGAGRRESLLSRREREITTDRGGRPHASRLAAYICLNSSSVGYTAKRPQS